MPWSASRFDAPVREWRLRKRNLAAASRVSGKYFAARRVFGVVNTVGQVAAFVSPLLFGYLLEVSQRNFTLVFHCIVGIFVAAGAASILIGRPNAKN